VLPLSHAACHDRGHRFIVDPRHASDLRADLSTGFIVARYGMPHAPPMTFLAWRYVLSIVCFGVRIALARVARPRGLARWRPLRAR